MKLKCDVLLSSFAFIFILRRYTEEQRHLLEDFEKSSLEAGEHLGENMGHGGGAGGRHDEKATKVWRCRLTKVVPVLTPLGFSAWKQKNNELPAGSGLGLTLYSKP